jgi:DNA polymerase/3'-5' exonuclease PolX
MNNMSLPTLTAMTWEVATEAATQITAALAPYCWQIEVGGSIRRKKPAEIKDVEIVAIPMNFETGLFKSGIALAMENWQLTKGHINPGARYIAALAPVMIKGSRYLVKVDLFLAKPHNFGYIFAIRTGPADFSARLLGLAKNRGYRFEDGQVYYQRSDPDGNRSAIPCTIGDEQDMFDIAGLAFIEPENRH